MNLCSRHCNQIGSQRVEAKVKYLLKNSKIKPILVDKSGKNVLMYTIQNGKRVNTGSGVKALPLTSTVLSIDLAPLLQIRGTYFFKTRGFIVAFTKLNLHPKIFQAIATCGYTKPTPVQSQVIPHIVSGRDVVASAQTGTGKTAAYVLPALQLLLTKKTIGKPRILILAPTRELATQITKVIDQYRKSIKINIVNIVGGMSYHRQLKELSRSIDIIIATPGRLMDHMENKRLDLTHIEMLIVDEADRMLDMGFINDIKTIVQATSVIRQTLLFSATTDDRLLLIMKNLLKNPIKINISEDKINTDLIKQKVHIVSNQHNKKILLEQLLQSENIYKAIIFSATKRNAAKLAQELLERGYAAAPMHGDLKQSVRNRTLGKFRTGEVQFLVATDVAARGIDILDISHVINYDLPKFVEDYVHRIGRTGRAGKTGVAVSIAHTNEVRQIKKIEKYIGNKIQHVHLTATGEKGRLTLNMPNSKNPHQTKHKKKKFHFTQNQHHNNSKSKEKHKHHKSKQKRSRRNPYTN